MPGVIGFGGAAKELGFDRRTNVWFERGEGLEQAVQTDPVRLRGIVTKLFTPWPVDHAVARGCGEFAVRRATGVLTGSLRALCLRQDLRFIHRPVPDNDRSAQFRKTAQMKTLLIGRSTLYKRAYQTASPKTTEDLDPFRDQGR